MLQFSIFFSITYNLWNFFNCKYIWITSILMCSRFALYWVFKFFTAIIKVLFTLAVNLGKHDDTSVSREGIILTPQALVRIDTPLVRFSVNGLQHWSYNLIIVYLNPLYWLNLLYCLFCNIPFWVGLISHLL